MAISATIYRRLLTSRPVSPLSQSRFLSLLSLDSTMATISPHNLTPRSVSTLSQQRFLMSATLSRQVDRPAHSCFTHSRPARSSISRKFSTHMDTERFRRDRLRLGVRLLVCQEEACVIERFGKFSRILEAGMHLLLPVVGRIAYVKSLKTHTMMIPEQLVITSDNVHVKVNALLFVKVKFSNILEKLY